MKSKLTQARLKELLHYDPETGGFTWIKGLGCRPAGSRAGCIRGTNGYRRIRVDGQLHLAHRLAFLYMEGYFPEYQVDHKLGVVDDNRWDKIRHVTPTCNLQNRMVHPSNTSGFTGVTWDYQRKKWQSQITIEGRNVHIGRYDTALDAALARITFEDWCPKWHCDERNINRKKVLEALRGTDLQDK